MDFCVNRVVKEFLLGPELECLPGTNTQIDWTIHSAIIESGESNYTA